MSAASSRSMMAWPRSSCVSRLAGSRLGCGGAPNASQHVLVEEVGERAVADVVQQPGDPQRLDHERLGRDRVLGRRALRPRAGVERFAQRGIEGGAPQAGLVHDAQAVREAAVLGRREDPAGALQLADAAQALHPRRVEQVLLRDGLAAEAGRGASASGVSRLVSSMYPWIGVADEVDRGESWVGHARSLASAAGRAGMLPPWRWWPPAGPLRTI